MHKLHWRRVHCRCVHIRTTSRWSRRMFQQTSGRRFRCPDGQSRTRATWNINVGMDNRKRYKINTKGQARENRQDSGEVRERERCNDSTRHHRVLQTIDTYVWRHRSATIRPHPERGMARQCMDTHTHGMHAVVKTLIEEGAVIGITTNRARISPNEACNRRLQLCRRCLSLTRATRRSRETHLLREQNIY